MNVRSYFNRPERVCLRFSKPSLTLQAQKDECDINRIMTSYTRTGIIEHGNAKIPRYDDVSMATDYRQSLENVMEAEASFMELPSKVRKRFENDPGQFLDFVSDPKNIDEMYDLGILTKRHDAAIAETEKVSKASDSDTPVNPT